MNSAKRLFTALIFGFFLGITIKETYNLTARQPCHWKYPPIVLNCSGNEIKEETIKRAIEYWDSKGEKVYFYEYNRLNSICKDVDLLSGFIVLKTQETEKLEQGVLASTKRSSKLGIIQSATIVFKPGTHNFILLLEHELGHAFGYSHRKIPGHIMHPYYDLMGDKFW